MLLSRNRVSCCRREAFAASLHATRARKGANDRTPHESCSVSGLAGHRALLPVRRRVRPAARYSGRPTPGSAIVTHAAERADRTVARRSQMRDHVRNMIDV
jgi:hypothetical protein